jgi:HJR/Mrr/RecB family endonuclease
MGKISRDSIKKLIKRHFDVSVTNGGADEIAKILEAEAKRISDFAVSNAKRRGDKVTKKDIREYVARGRR